MRRHWEALALERDVIPLDVDWDRYLALAATGQLCVTTARFDGLLVGYILNLVSGHLHYRSTLHAHMDAYWLDPAYRGGLEVIRWFRLNEEHLRSLGVRKVTGSEKLHYLNGRVGLIFQRLGFRPVERTWSKVL